MNFISASNNSILLNENTFSMDASNTRLYNIDSDQFCTQNKNINEVWTKKNFDCLKGIDGKKGYLRANLSLDLSALKTTWSIRNSDDEKSSDEDSDEGQLKIDHNEVLSPTVSIPEKEVVSPSHHARRPMNAFLIFCKKHRPIVRQRYPHLENRGVTRILGEWWALLDEDEKNCYTTLAKEYKDAFFSANPDFKWYKLPAPPLRTLVSRPTGLQKPASPLASPTQLTPSSAVFTPGKLADETQLGNLTSLMNVNNNNNNNNNLCNTSKALCSNDNECEFNESQTNYINNNNDEKYEQVISPPNTGIDISTPLKPIKKRFFEHPNNSRKIARNIFNEFRDSMDEFDVTAYHEHEAENLTQQELMNKVVDSMFPDKNVELDNMQDENKEKSKVTRKSLRSCKGKRYAEFMLEGKLFGNKQMKRQLEVDDKFESTFNNKIEGTKHNKSDIQTPKLDLSDTIKRLAERTNIKIDDVFDIIGEEDIPEGLINNNGKRKRTESENSEENLAKLHADFNLELRISSLPSLSYETFMQRKRDSKKRKYFRSKSESSVSPTKLLLLSKTDDSALVGSKKRKNKHKITRLEKPPDPPESSFSTNFNNDLFGLATLAEVAANTEKIN